MEKNLGLVFNKEIMKENLTEIVTILDASGSMDSLAQETISGYNTFIEEQKKLPGEAKLTTVLFNSSYKRIYDRVDIHTAKPLTENDYKCDSMTALLDAMGKTIDDIGKKLSKTPEEDRPSKVIVMIITDGEENASKKFTASQIKEKIDIQKNVYSWEFIFLAKDIQTVTYANNIGIQNAMMYDASSIGTQNVFNGLSKQTSNYRSSRSINLDELKEDLKENI
jgi:uncharacterized protein YegL